MRAEIISVGTELLLGDIVNTNAQFLARELAGLGYSVFYQTVVGDNVGRLRSLVNEAKARSDVLVFTGGLGPTEDDLTKETVAEAFGDGLQLDHEELARLEEFFIRRGLKMGENNRKQAMVPVRGRKLPNPNGTAPGAFFRQGGKYAVLLPGPPREMQPMFLNEVVPLLESMQDSAIRSLTLRVFGIGESELEDKVLDLLENQNPTAALYAKTGEVHIRITAKAPTADVADMMCEEYAILFRRTLGDLIYSENGDDLETTAVKLLAAKSCTVATAESCTGGLLGERITSVPGSSSVYGYGAITYANEAKHQMLRVSNNTLKKFGAVSSQVAAEMAFGAARRGRDDYGIGITGIAGPDGGTVQKPVGLVYIALAHGKQVYVKRLSMNDRGRAYVRELATQHALDMLRRAALGLEIPDAKRFAKNQEADYDRVGRPKLRGGPLGHTVLAMVLAVALFALLLTAIWYMQDAARNKQPPKPEGAPSTLGLAYGTEAYTEAANALVRSQREENPAVAGFVAMPVAAEDEVMENLVAQPSAGSQAQLADSLDQAGAEGLPVMAYGASPARQAANVMILGEASFRQLYDFADPDNASAVSTFTYYTSNDAKVYQVFAAYMADEGEPGGGFDPAVENLPDYSSYLQFALGTKARSLYDIPIAPAQDGSFMTLAAADPTVEGRCFYICGQLVAPGQEPADAPAAQAASPLMPLAWYGEQEQELTPPDKQETYNYWMRWYLTREQTNSELQLLCGMPGTDAYPMVQQQSQQPTLPTQSEPETPAGGEAGSPASQPGGASAPAGARPPSDAAVAPHGGGSSAAAGSARAADAFAQAAGTPVRAQAVLALGAGPRLLDAGDGGDGGDGGGRGADSSSSAASNADSSSGSGSDSNSGSDVSSASGSDTGSYSDSGLVSGVEPPSSSTQASAAPSSSAPAIYIPPTPRPQRADPGTLTVTMNGQVVTGSTADVLAQICQAEAAGQSPAVIKAVAIAAHSWILNLQGAGYQAPPVVGRQPSPEMRALVEEVAHLMLSPDGTNPAFCTWFAMAANGTNNASAVFGGERAYLEGVASPYEQNMENWRSYVTITPEEMQSLAQERLGVTLALAEGETPEGWLTDLEKNENGYVISLKVGGREVTGYDFWRRVLVRDGERLLESGAFELSWDGEKFSFITYGSGHGCGMSLAGAASYAREDWSYDRILEHYYPGTELTELT